jgi:hypothetical protein
MGIENDNFNDEEMNIIRQTIDLSYMKHPDTEEIVQALNKDKGIA